tara:strand:+ start:366 stop:983 length:618 start_codon:yes stop_codon:yes gene_type:complete
MKKISILNYDMGNMWSLISVLQYLNYETKIINNYKEIKKSEKIILPGVGSFPLAMKRIKNKNYFNEIKEHVLQKNRPILGICLGMQLLCSSSTEGKSTKGFNFINLKVDKFKNLNKKKKYHIGFNQVKKLNNSILLKNINKNLDFYFVHAFRAKPISIKNVNLIKSNYSEEFVSAFEYKNIFGTQFHPEKSHKNGIILLKNFLNI